MCVQMNSSQKCELPPPVSMAQMQLHLHLLQYQDHSVVLRVQENLLESVNWVHFGY